MSAVRAFVARRTPFVLVQRAAFSQSIARCAGKESTLNTEGRAEEVEEKKHEQLQSQKDGKGYWEERLASDSESILKAERNEMGKDTEKIIKELQEETAKVAGEK